MMLRRNKTSPKVSVPKKESLSDWIAKYVCKIACGTDSNMTSSKRTARKCATGKPCSPIPECASFLLIALTAVNATPTPKKEQSKPTNWTSWDSP